MRFFHGTKIRFMEYRWHWIIASTILNLVAIVLIFVGPGFKYGVDFAGGTQLTLKFKAEPDLGRVRKALEALNLGDVSIQRFDEAALHQILVHMQNPKGQEGDFTARMLQALQKEFGGGTGQLEINLQGSDALRDGLAQADPDMVGGSFDERRAHYKPMSDEVLELRKRVGIIGGVDDLRSLAPLSPGVKSYLSASAHFGEFALLAAENVGPVVGKDLREKAIYAVGFSLLGMLVYIWFRFKLQYGIGAIVANFHDTLITLGALVLTKRPINLPTIAALLTLVGYSTNDTVVIFDRIRERLKLERGKPLITVMDEAINATLSRTIITSGLTWAVVLALFIFGGDVINTFAFVLVIGIVVGTYSSMYIASPIALGMSNWLDKRKVARRRR
ncbi:MAG: protein translocase subunit SecF [Thermoanaerobaculaceae bacterium]|jgi:preprotein translocase subunit SecF